MINYSDTYIEALKMVKNRTTSIKEIVIRVIEINKKVTHESEINKERYMTCYNKFNKDYNMDVYFETKEHNDKIDRWIERENGYNKKKKESYKKCIRDYIIYELKMGKELLSIVCDIFEKDVLDLIEEIGKSKNYDKTIDDEEW